MRAGFLSRHGKGASAGGSWVPLVAVMLLAAVGAAVFLRIRSEGDSSGVTPDLSSTTGTPAVPLPHRSAPNGAGV
jgi:hypothetical protein